MYAIYVSTPGQPVEDGDLPLYARMALIKALLALRTIVRVVQAGDWCGITFADGEHWDAYTV